MSREYGIHPTHFGGKLKPWHIEAMLLDMEQRRG